MHALRLCALLVFGALGACDFGYSIGTLPDGGADRALPDAAGACPSGQATVHIRNMAFEPKALTVPVGTHVIWINDDTMAQDVTQGNPGDARSDFTSGSIAPGASWGRDFCTPGTTVYFCSVHPDTMRDATVVVTP
jgi:plastocyanin